MHRTAPLHRRKDDQRTRAHHPRARAPLPPRRPLTAAAPLTYAPSPRFPDNTPRTKEAYWYRTIFEGHFPSKAAADTVPGGPSVACSTATAAKWDAAWAGKEDPSGRAALGVHDEAYDKAAAADGGEQAAAAGGGGPASKKARVENGK